jgi:hypothetical protein
VDEWIRRRGGADGPAIRDAMRSAGVREIVGAGAFDPADHGKDYAMRAFGAIIAIHFVDEVDLHASPIGARGIGELGATGVAAAVANAVFDATGKRIRRLPITPAKLVAER